MKTKKILIVLAIVITIGSIAFILFVSFNKKNQKQNSFYVPPPKISNYVSGSINYQINIKENDFNFPSEAPLLENSSVVPYTEEETKTIAQKLNFSSDPIVANDVFDGKTYLWNSKDANLTVWTQTRRVKYNLTKDVKTINKQIDEGVLKKTASDFLSNYFNLNEEELNFSSIIYLKTNQSDEGYYPTTKNEASIYQIDFSPKSSAFSLLTIDPQKTPYSVWVLPDGTVYEADINSVGKLTPGITKYKLKNFKQFNNSVRNSTIVSVDDGNIDPKDVSKNSIQEITVYEVKLVYLIDSILSPNFQPVFLIQGKISISNFNKNVNVSLYLPAIIEVQP